MAKLSHPSVVPVFDVGTHGDQVFVAMELVDGDTLKRALRERPRPWREVLAMFAHAGRGLAAAHEAGIVHRDFKPENVLVGKDGRVRVTDG
jgi:serine/threonine protein kinase